MKHYRTYRIFWPALVATLVTPPSASADMVDYGSLQSLFGEPVTTSATGTPQRVSDVAADMTIITADQIRQSGSRNIPQIIGQYVPGIDILQTGLDSFDVGVRGYQQPYQPRLLVLVDGRQVFIDDYSRTIWGNIPVNINDIRQIEVVKGASSALFGSNAAGGVVNIITYSPVYDHNNVASASYGTQNEISGDATVTRSLGDGSGVKISAGGLHSDEFNSEKPNANDPHIYEPMHQYATESSVFQLKPGLQAMTEMTYSVSHDNPQQPALTGRAAEDTRTYSLRGGFQWQTDYGMISNNNYFYHAGNDAEVSGAYYPETTDLYVSQLQDQFKIGTENTVRLAMEYRYKNFYYDYQQSFQQSPEFSQNVFSPSGAWLWQINDSLSWTNAARLDHQSQQQTGTLFSNAFYNDALYTHDINALSANSGLVYKATDVDTLRATYGRGVQPPSFLEGGDNVVVANANLGANSYVDLEGNPFLKPTIVQNYELAYDRQLPSLFSDVKIAPFYEINDDIIAFDVLNTSSPRVIMGNSYYLDQSQNVGKSQGFGGELEFKGAHDGYRWDASYSYSRVEDAALVEEKLGYEGSAPAHHFRLSGGYTTGPWEMDAYGQVVTNLHEQTAVGTTKESSGYFALSGRVGYKIDERFTLALSGTNLTQANTDTSPFPAIERQVFVTLTGHF